MPQFTRHGAELFYIEQGAGPTVLFLHGHTLDHTTWDEQVAALAPAFRCICLDVRGHGRSGTPEAGDATDDVLALLDHLEVSQAALVGASMGGGIALQTALRAPERVTALALLGAAVDDFAWTWPGARPHALTARNAGLAAGSAGWLADPLFATTLAQPRLAAQLRRVVAGFGGDPWLKRSPKPAHPPLPVLQHLDVITAPALVLVGEYDLPDFHAIARQLATLRHAEHHVIAGAGHLCGLEAPAQVNALLRAFLGAHAAPVDDKL